MENRRDFVKKIARTKAATGFISKTKAKKVTLKNVFVHHVFFWLKEPENPEARSQFEIGLHELGKIRLVQSGHIGTPQKSPREVVDDSFTYSYLAIFKKKEDQDLYQTHPIHLKFIEDCQHLWDRVIVYDALD